MFQVADIDPATAGRIAHVVQPLLAVSQLLMISRIVLSWYPQVKAVSADIPSELAV